MNKLQAYTQAEAILDGSIELTELLGKASEIAQEINISADKDSTGYFYQQQAAIKKLRLEFGKALGRFTHILQPINPPVCHRDSRAEVKMDQSQQKQARQRKR